MKKDNKTINFIVCPNCGKVHIELTKCILPFKEDNPAGRSVFIGYGVTVTPYFNEVPYTEMWNRIKKTGEIVLRRQVRDDTVYDKRGIELPKTLAKNKHDTFLIPDREKWGNEVVFKAPDYVYEMLKNSDYSFIFEEDKVCPKCHYELDRKTASKNEVLVYFTEGKLGSVKEINEQINNAKQKVRLYKENAYIDDYNLFYDRRTVSAPDGVKDVESFDYKDLFESLVKCYSNLEFLKRRYSVLKFDSAKWYREEVRKEENKLRSELFSVWKELNNKLDSLKKEHKNVQMEMEFDESKINYDTYSYREISKPEEPVMLEYHFFNKKKILAENERRMEVYKEQLSEYEANVQRKKDIIQQAESYWPQTEKYRQLEAKASNLDKQIQKINSKIADNNKSRSISEVMKAVDKKTIQQQSKQLFGEEEDEVTDLIIKNIRLRNFLENLGGIHKKYCNLAAATSMLEYFDTGRVYELKGPQGAYNLYEAERKQNIIISKLDDIMTELQKIQRNQYMLYSILTDINEKLDTISDHMQEMTVSLGTIEETTATTAYNTYRTAIYAKMNAELTRSFGFMLAMK